MKRQSIKLNSNYIVLESWMTQELGLSGNELIVYAIIYGFSQTEKQVCSCGDEYMASWLNIDERSIVRIKNKLLSRKLIEKVAVISTSKQDKRKSAYRAIRPNLCDKMSCNSNKIGDTLSCNLDDKMSCKSSEIGDILSEKVTICPKIGDNLSSRASLDNNKYNIKNNNNILQDCDCGISDIKIIAHDKVPFCYTVDSEKAFVLWKSICDKLEIDVHSLGFDVWIKPLKPLGFCDNTLILQAPSAQAAEEVKTRYLPLITKCLSETNI